ncbi:MAG: MlaD family protein [Candidatus Dormibacteraeota bacterium]|nr:MlaD family protein [Candidatus Dormibacteraeota bacterium]
MKRAITTHATDFVAIIVLLVLSVVVAGYILHMERLRFPFVQSSPTKMYAELPTGQAFTPGQGQSVRVSGVQIGQIGGVQLENGRARIEMDIDQKYTHLIHTDATALARPRTGLQDLFLEVNPGTLAAPKAQPGFTLPVSNTLPEVNLDEILAGLDGDTRAYLKLLINGAGAGLQTNGGSELANVLKRFLPTHRDLARLNTAVAVRGDNLRRLINSLQRLNTSLGTKQSQIVSLVDASSTVFKAFASQDANVSRAIADLPATLRQTTATLAKVQSFAGTLGPTAASLLPAARALPAANAAISALAKPSAPIVQSQIRPFVVAARPLVRNLRPAAINLARATPNLTGAFGVLNHLFNLLGYNPGDSPTGGQHGYLWWLAWGDHSARTLFSVQDPNGAFRPLFIQVSCAQLATTPAGGAGNLASAAGIALGVLGLAPVQARCKKLGLSQDMATAAAKAAGGGSGGPAGAGTGSGSGAGSRNRSASSSTTAAAATTTAAATSSSTSTASAGPSTIAAVPPIGKSALTGAR